MHPGVIFAYTRVHPSASQAFTRQFAALGGATKIPPGAPEAAKQPPQKLSPAKLPEMRLLSMKRAVFVDRRSPIWSGMTGDTVGDDGRESRG